ncbi:ATP-binding protein [Thalassotalea fusca]
MKSVKFSQSLAFRLNVFIFSMSVIIVTAIALIFMQVGNKKLLERVNHQLELQSQTLSVAFQANPYGIHAERIIASLTMIPALNRLSLIRESDHKIVATNYVNGINGNDVLSPSLLNTIQINNKRTTDSPWENTVIQDVYYYFYPILLVDTESNKSQRFLLMYEYDLTNEQQALINEMLDYLLIVSLGFAGLLIANIFNIQTQIISPLKKLSYEIQRTAADPVPVEETNNELGILSSAYNTSINIRRQQELQLAQSRRHIDSIAFQVPVLLAYIDKTLSITYANQRFLAWINKTTEDIGTLDFKTIIDEYTNFDCSKAVEQTLKGQPQKFDGIFQLNGLLNRNIHINLIPDIDDNNQVVGFFSCIDDYTQLEKNKQEIEHYARKLEVSNVVLEQAKCNAEKAEKIKADFLACMSHEIRTPMNGIIGMLDILGRSNLKQEQTELLKLADASAHDLLSLINDILDFSKIESGKLTLESIPFNIKDEILSTVKLLSIQSDKKGLQIKVQPDIFNNQIVIGDPTRFRQILVNLIGNAIKFTQEGEIIIQPSMTVMPNDKVCFSCAIEDSGIGMTPEQQHSLFKPFTQADSTTTRQYGGTGLGLAIVKQLCQQMGGDINVDSNFGEGATFTFSLQLTVAKELPIESETTAAIEQKNVIKLSGSHKILLAEDNKINQIVAKKALAELSIDVEIVENGQLAINKLSESGDEYALVLMDCLMPELDGYEATKAIRRGEAGTQNKQITIIAMTANAMKGDREKCLAVGMNDYIAKPVKIENLKQLLAKWLTPEPEESVTMPYKNTPKTHIDLT